jgi:glycosyltransferase involved in cell wall biosynthesis
MNFCFIPWVDWDAYLHSRPHQLVKDALRRGHRVLYVNPNMRPSFRQGNLEIWHPLSSPIFGLLKKTLRGELFRKRSLPAAKRLTPMRELIYRPYEDNNRNARLSKVFIDRITRQKLRTFRRLGEKNIVVFQQPFPSVFEIPYMKGLGYTIIYDMIDDWSNYLDSPEYFAETEPYLLRSADIVTATAKTLYQRAIQHNQNTYLCPNAADFEHFRRARAIWESPQDLPPRRPRIGFFGVMREWFDAELVAFSASHRPEYDFCLIGGYLEEILQKLEGLSNVHLLGEKPYSYLPQYLHHFDAAIIPFKVNELIRSTNPIKVYEYLAGGKPVVATEIPEIQHMPFVYVSKGTEEFIRHLDLAVRTPVDLSEVDNFLVNETWGKRFDVIETAISNTVISRSM